MGLKTTLRSFQFWLIAELSVCTSKCTALLDAVLKTMIYSFTELQGFKKNYRLILATLYEAFCFPDPSVKPSKAISDVKKIVPYLKSYTTSIHIEGKSYVIIGLRLIVQLLSDDILTISAMATSLATAIYSYCKLTNQNDLAY